jgi:hypothetical protein
METRLSDWIKSAPVGKTTTYELLAVLGIKPGKVRSRGVSAAVSVLNDEQVLAMDKAALAVSTGTPVAQIAAIAPTPSLDLEALELRLVAVLEMVRAAMGQPLSTRACATIVAPAPKLPLGKMSRAVLFSAIISQYENFTEHRGRYDVKEFRQLCEPLLAKHFHTEDVEPNRDGVPKWYGRFCYAHSQHAAGQGYIHESNGFFIKLST